MRTRIYETLTFVANPSRDLDERPDRTMIGILTQYIKTSLYYLFLGVVLGGKVKGDRNVSALPRSDSAQRLNIVGVSDAQAHMEVPAA